MNYSCQGNWGFGEAISYFSLAGYNVSQPAGDANLPYDMIVEKNDIFYPVQVKTTMYKGAYGWYRVGLQNSSRNASGTTKKRMSIKAISFLFVATPDGNYCIPTSTWKKTVPTVLEFGPKGRYINFLAKKDYTFLRKKQKRTK